MREPPVHEQPTVEQLIDLLVEANEPRVGYSGLYTELEGGSVTRRWRVWRLRNLARIEDPPGRLSLLAGSGAYWRSWPIDEGVTRIPRDPEIRFDFDLSLLASPDPHGYWSAWLGMDAQLVVTTLHRTEHEGRPAWRFTAPWIKSGHAVLTVDAELGLLVRAEGSDTGVVCEWTALRLLPSLDASFFEHDEPAEPAERTDHDPRD